MPHDTLIRFGGPVKVLSRKGDLATIGGPGVVFDDPEDPVKDLAGDYFTAETYFGAHKGNGVDCAFHHGFPIEAKTDFAKGLSEHFFPPVKAETTEEAIVASVVLDMRKEYERFAFEQAEKSLLSWSSGAVGHLVKRMEDGWLKVWPIGEWSLTPTPAEPRTLALPIKSLLAAHKAVNLSARFDAVYTAFWQLIDREAPYDWDSYVAEIWDEFAIVRVESIVGAGWYRVPYTYDGQTATLAPVDQWEKVEPVGAQAEGWEAMKSLYHASTADLTSAKSLGGHRPARSLDELALAFKMQNLNLQSQLIMGR